MNSATATPVRTLAGWPVRQGVIVMLLCLNTVWAAWATKTLVELQERRIVTVGLTGLLSDFVAAESRRTSSPEQAAARTRTYLAALDHAIGELERDGSVILVRESVLGHRVADETASIRDRVTRSMPSER